MTTITRQTCRLLSADTLKALEAVAQKHGLTVSMGSGRFSAGSATLKVEYTATVEADADGTPGAPVDFARHAAIIGLDDHAFGRVFTAGGVEYRVSGIRLTRRKYPVSAVRTRDQRSFKFDVATVNRRLAAGA